MAIYYTRFDASSPNNCCYFVGYLAVLVPLPASIAYGSSTNSLLPAGYITWDENSMLMDTCQDELNNLHGNEGTHYAF
jgi:hypothetical protein